MKTQDEMRGEFERLGCVRTILSKGLFFYSSYANCYKFIDTMVCINAKPSQHKNHGYLNGAWYAFQEQQKKIDKALKHVVDHGGYDDLTHVINILKGNKDEN